MAPDTQTTVDGLLRFPTEDPKSGGSLHLISKGSFGGAFAGPIASNGTTTYSVPAGDYDAIAMGPFRFGSISTTTYSPLKIPAAGGERNVPPLSCSLAEYNANYSACLSVSNAEYLVCDATYPVNGHLLEWAACYNAVSARFSKCIECSK